SDKRSAGALLSIDSPTVASSSGPPGSRPDGHTVFGGSIAFAEGPKRSVICVSSLGIEVFQGHVSDTRTAVGRAALVRPELRVSRKVLERVEECHGAGSLNWSK